jgi:hypothetical protein
MQRGGPIEPCGVGGRLTYCNLSKCCSAWVSVVWEATQPLRDGVDPTTLLHKQKKIREILLLTNCGVGSLHVQQVGPQAASQ